MSPYWSANRRPKIIETATGATTYGSRTPMRQNVAARRFWSSSAAIAIAAITWGTEDSRKIETVLRRDFQNVGCASTSV